MNYPEYDPRRYRPGPAEALQVGADDLAAVLEFVPALARTASILEIGCGAGSLLAALRHAGFPNARGLEPAPTLAQHASSVLGLAVTQAGWIEHLERHPHERYDLIIALDVLEHLPRETVPTALGLCAQRLGPAGHLLLRMPNADCPLVQPIFYGDITHRFLATPALLRHLLIEAGFASDVRFGETRLGRGWKRGLWRTGHVLVVRPLVRWMHFHFHGTFPRVVTPNMYCCAMRAPD